MEPTTVSVDISELELVENENGPRENHSVLLDVSTRIHIKNIYNTISVINIPLICKFSLLVITSRSLESFTIIRKKMFIIHNSLSTAIFIHVSLS